jgi:hypothetical protein
MDCENPAGTKPVINKLQNKKTERKSDRISYRLRKTLIEIEEKITTRGFIRLSYRLGVGRRPVDQHKRGARDAVNQEPPLKLLAAERAA